MNLMIGRRARVHAEPFACQHVFGLARAIVDRDIVAAPGTDIVPNRQSLRLRFIFKLNAGRHGLRLAGLRLKAARALQLVDSRRSEMAAV